MKKMKPVKWGFLYLALVLALVIGSTSPTWAEEKSASEIAHELANPNTSLGFLANILDYTTYDGDLPDSDNQESWRYSFQPSIPYPIAKGTNFFLRPLIPVFIDQPVYGPDGFDDEGVDLGDIGFDIAIGKGFPSGWQVIGGMAGTLDTASNDDLGGGQTRLGPEFFLGKKTDWGFLGALVSHQWDVAGDDYATSITAGQYFITYNFEDAWQFQVQPTWAYNHQADDSDDKLTLPIGAGVSKTILVGKMPLKFSVQYWNYVASPDTFGPEHQIRFQVAPVVPLPW